MHIMHNREILQCEDMSRFMISICAGLLFGLTFLCQSGAYAQTGTSEHQFAQLTERRFPDRPIRQEPIAARPAKAWQQVWTDLWKRLDTARRLEVASSIREVSVCQGALEPDRLVHGAVGAMASGKQGDAARLLGRFQDKSM